tara:strand:+ start:2237 stop:3298 length:1062 start_codon:yes stop_codon:yes gene_type:complete
MAVAPHSTRWTHRLNGENPATPAGQNNGAWSSTVSGTVVGKFWAHGGLRGAGYNKINPTTDTLTLVASFKYETTPAAGTLLFSLESTVGEVKIVSAGNDTQLTMESKVGLGVDSITISNLELKNSFFFRLTLDAHVAKFYPFDLKETETGESLVHSTTSTTTSNPKNSFGCNNGDVLFGNFYFTDQGVFDTDEFSPSLWTSNLLQQTGLRVIELLKDSNRMYLKTQVEPESIIYANDMSPATVSRYDPPCIYVQVPSMRTDIESLGGGTVFHQYQVQVFVITKASDYRFAHRINAELSGEVVEEIYANSGESSNKDSIIDFNSEIDMRQEEEEIICVNAHTFTFKRRINYRER